MLVVLRQRDEARVVSSLAAPDVEARCIVLRRKRLRHLIWRGFATAVTGCVAGDDFQGSPDGSEG